MRPRVRRLAVIVGASAVLGATGCGAANSTSQQSSASSGAQQQQSSAAQAPAGAPDLSGLATKLGVSESKLRAAMEATRPSGTPGQAPSGDPATALAKELGLSAAKVRAAMQAVGPPGGGQPPSGSAPAAPSSSSSASPGSAA
jgi:hypothetical protein